ncbi:hypothetical protein [Embleya sp. NPDC020886]|uniref:hypothetical protein n=1 Tax=Embleya sp. NPDC020886 TaxID=3363980 RepID=UPI0037B2D428
MRLVASRPERPGGQWIHEDEPEARHVPSTCIPTRAAEELSVEQYAALAILRRPGTRGPEDAIRKLTARSDELTARQARARSTPSSPPSGSTPRAATPAPTPRTAPGRTRLRELVMLGRRLWIAPIDPHCLQCVAATVRSRRRRNPLEYGQIMTMLQVQLGAVGYVHAYRPFGTDREVASRWLAQHCTVRDTPDAVDTDTTELRPFRLDTDGHLVRRYRTDALID